MFNIRVRLMQIGKKQCDLIPALESKGIKTDPAEISKVLSGYYQTPKADKILKSCNEIVSEWEGRKIVSGDTSKGVYNGTCTDIR